MSSPTTTDSLYAAVKHVLDRAQENPDLGYYIGPGMQSFHLLCKAEAQHLGRPLADVERARGRDLQPSYRKRKPEVVERRDEVHRLRSIIEGCPRCLEEVEAEERRERETAR